MERIVPHLNAFCKAWFNAIGATVRWSFHDGNVSGTPQELSIGFGAVANSGI